MASLPSHPALVLGASSIGDRSRDSMARFDTAEEVNALLHAFRAGGHRELDAAYVYSPQAHGSCEIRLGLVKAAERFILNTKVFSHAPGAHRKENILKGVQDALDRLGVSQINMVSLHAADRSVPFEEPCEALSQACREGKIKQWGISNFRVDEVLQLIAICDRNGWQRPSAYQGQYNPLVRGAERELIPILREHGIVFSAYSPAGGGFFAANHKDVQDGGRYDPTHILGQLYRGWYMKDSISKCTDKALAVASKHGITGHAAALRWSAYHGVLDGSRGDSIVLGTSSVEQLEQNLESIEQGPLPDEVAAALDGVFAETAGDEILYHL